MFSLPAFYDELEKIAGLTLAGMEKEALSSKLLGRAAKSAYEKALEAHNKIPTIVGSMHHFGRKPPSRAGKEMLPKLDAALHTLTGRQLKRTRQGDRFLRAGIKKQKAGK